MAAFSLTSLDQIAIFAFGLESRECIVPRKKQTTVDPELARVLSMKAAYTPNIPYTDTPAVVERLITTILRRVHSGMTEREIYLAGLVLRLEKRWLAALQADVTELAMYSILRAMESKGRVCSHIPKTGRYRVIYSLAYT